MNKFLIVVLSLTMVFMISGVASGDLSDGLVSYYPSNGNANYESGKGYDGTVYDAILTKYRFGNSNRA